MRPEPAGPLPPLANLTYLQYLDLSNNFLTVRPGRAYEIHVCLCVGAFLGN